MPQTSRPSPHPSPWQSFYNRHEYRILPCMALIIFFIIWELIPALGWVRPLFISSPSRIIIAAQWLFEHGLWHDIRVSSTEFWIGYALAVLIGIPSGIVLGWYRRLHAIFDPFVSILYVTPRIALLPLLILWFGIGINSKIAVVFLGAVFPILINVLAGMRTIDPILLKCSRSFGATDYQIFTTLAIPSSIPFMIAGMRLAVGRALVGIVVGELVAANAGVGYMMRVAGATFQTDKVFVGIFLLAGAGYGLTELLKSVENYCDRWRMN